MPSEADIFSVRDECSTATVVGVLQLVMQNVIFQWKLVKAKD